MGLLRFQRFVLLTFRVVYLLRFGFLCVFSLPPETMRHQLLYGIFVDITLIYLFDYKTCFCFALVSNGMRIGGNLL